MAGRATKSLGRGGRPTLADVAARVGVAVSTVSRALTDPDRVNAATRQRILTAADELGYVTPERSAPRGPAREDVVAVLVPDTLNSFTLDIIRGTQRELRSAGRHQVLIDTDGSPQLEEALLRRAKGLCGGAVIAAPRLPDTRIEALERATVPLVTINRPRRTGGSVVVDTPAGAGQAVEHLVSLGHRHLIYVSGPHSSWSSERRWRTIVATAARHDIQVDRTGPHPAVHTAGTGAAEAVVNSGATGVIAFNDVIAIRMLQRFAERSVAVPEQLSVVGCDDGFAAACCAPALTTISADYEAAGRAAVSLLLDGGLPHGGLPDEGLPAGALRDRTRRTRAGADRRRQVVLPTHLVVRDSTGPAPTARR